MTFYSKKLPVEAATDLISCSLASVQPYALMLGPAYVFMPLNHKFVAIKAPLDFFSEDELSCHRLMETLYFPKSIESAERFRGAARSVRELLMFDPEALLWSKVTERRRYPEVRLGPTPYENSDLTLRIFSSLWRPDFENNRLLIRKIAPVVLADELCGMLPGESLLRAREEDVARYEESLLVSSWAVFFALHLGEGNLDFLKRLRRGIFLEQADIQPQASRSRTTEELVEATRGFLGAAVVAEDSEFYSVSGEALARLTGRGAEKLRHRMAARLGLSLPSKEVALGL